MKKKKGISKQIIFTMLTFWVVLFAISSYILYTLNLSDSRNKLIFFILIPATLIITILIYLISTKYIKNQFSAVTKLIEDYGPGEKCADEIKLVIAKEKNSIMKMQYSFILANIYISEMAEPEKALEVLNSINKAKLFRKSNLGYQNMQCNFYYLLLISYGFIENNDAIISIYKEGATLFNRFFHNVNKNLIWNAINFDYQKAQGNYDDALKIIEPYLYNEDYKIRTATSLDCADIYIKTGHLEEAEIILDEFDSRQNNVAMNRIYNIIYERLQKAKETTQYN